MAFNFLASQDLSSTVLNSHNHWSLSDLENIHALAQGTKRQKSQFPQLSIIKRNWYLSKTGFSCSTIVKFLTSQATDEISSSTPQKKEEKFYIKIATIFSGAHYIPLYTLFICHIRAVYCNFQARNVFQLTKLMLPKHLTYGTLNKKHFETEIKCIDIIWLYKSSNSNSGGCK